MYIVNVYILSLVRLGHALEYLQLMKALKCKMLGAEFATELIVGNGRRINKSQIHVL